MVQVEQRTDEWYNIRNNMITASDVASALGINKYQSQNTFIKQKVNTNSQKVFNTLATSHGNKYEDEARLLFSNRFKLETWEIGLFQHKSISWLGGSPDGIASDGNLIEIKCPVTREITHNIPDHYYPQVQICMEVLERPFCYFIQYQPGNSFQNCILDIKKIPRNIEWFQNNINNLFNIWKKILFFRENGYCKFDPKKIIDLSYIDLPKLNNNYCLSDDDDDDDYDY